MPNIYVASSWRNQHYPQVVKVLKDMGHEVYDFRNPSPNIKGFSWSELDPEWCDWSRQQYVENLAHPLPQLALGQDFRAMMWADTFILVTPCGRSAHLEFGWAIGNRKRTYIYLPERIEPELMYLLADKIFLDLEELLAELEN
jgi:hypothetical protein